MVGHDAHVAFFVRSFAGVLDTPVTQTTSQRHRAVVWITHCSAVSVFLLASPLATKGLTYAHPTHVFEFVARSAGH